MLTLDWPRADVHALSAGPVLYGVRVLVRDGKLEVHDGDELVTEAELDALDRVAGSDVFRARAGAQRWIVIRRPTSSGQGRGCCG